MRFDTNLVPHQDIIEVKEKRKAEVKVFIGGILLHNVTENKFIIQRVDTTEKKKVEVEVDLRGKKYMDRKVKRLVTKRRHTHKLLWFSLQEMQN